jgi:hypothetical protein
MKNYSMLFYSNFILISGTEFVSSDLGMQEL